VTWLLIVLGALFLAAAVVYATRSASQLPSWWLGHDALRHTKHYKHAAAAVLLALACFAGAWFTTGRRHGAAAN